MKRFESWDEWETSVSVAGDDISLRDKLDFLLSASSLRPSQSTDAQHDQFIALSNDIKLEIESILKGDSNE
jgi:hypothetical protein